MNKNFSLLIKPASADCNLRCQYCFYLDRCELYPESKIHRMDYRTLERMISTFMAIPMDNYAFGWQGGEPTLMGVDFFREVVRLQQKHGRPGAKVANGLQTNGVLIDEELAAHFAEFQFLLGVSLDGPPEIHDHYRLDAAGSGSHAKVIKAIDILKKHKVEFNILVLVNALNVKKAAEIYKYFKDNGFNYLQFIPCVEFDNQNKPLPFAITGEEWGEFLCEIFDLWYKTDSKTVSIRLFDSILVLLVDHYRNICHIGRDCCQYFVVEHSGDVYPCDFFVREELRLGNINKSEWDDMINSQLYKSFGAKKRNWPQTCAKCECLEYCAGDCLKHRIYGSITTPTNLSWLCEGWKMFYRHSMPKFKKLVKTVEKMRKAQALQQNMRK